MTPTRIQRKRTKGWRMPPNTVYVGRPTKWGNLFAGSKTRTGRKADAKGFKRWISGAPQGYLKPPSREFLDSVKSELQGKNLACWCPLDQPCHADVLLELANAGPA